MFRTARLLLVAPLLLAMVAAGCGSGTSGRVSGKITYNGSPVTGGKIRFHPASGTSQEEGAAGYEATIQPDGTYTVTDVPVGEMIVTVETEDLNPKKKEAFMDPTGGMMKKMDPTAMLKQSTQVPQDLGGSIGTYMPIPAKYATKEKSDLKVTLKSGKNTYNPDLSGDLTQ